MSYVTNLALWLQYFNKLTYLLTYLKQCELTWCGSQTGMGIVPRDVSGTVGGNWSKQTSHIHWTPHDNVNEQQKANWCLKKFWSLQVTPTIGAQYRHVIFIYINCCLRDLFFKNIKPAETFLMANSVSFY